MQLAMTSTGKAATISPCLRYRYSLSREWVASPKRRVLFVMLNPSTADAEDDDPTLCRCMHFAKRLGFDALDVANLYGFRTPHPKRLFEADEPIGNANDDVMRLLACGADNVIAAWGNGAPPARERFVLELLRRTHREIHCLGLTKGLLPKHPLARGTSRIPDDVVPVDYLPEWEESAWLIATSEHGNETTLTNRRAWRTQPLLHVDTEGKALRIVAEFRAASLKDAQLKQRQLDRRFKR